MILDVLIPSLLLPAPVQKLMPPPAVPAIERLLARADRRVDATAEDSSWLCDRWGLAAPYALAPLLAAFDGLNSSRSGWMFAEPVHLSPDEKWLKMAPSRQLELTPAESLDLVSALNAHFAGKQIAFFAPTPSRWYVRCDPTEIPVTTPVDAARLGSLLDHQPKSSGEIDWRSMQNEAQMLFFGHPVNAAREAVGTPVVSGIWFWGGGAMPALKKPACDCVVTDSPLAAQLAKSTGIEVKPMDWASIASAQGNVLAVMDSCANLACDFDLPAWGRELERLDREWFRPISQALARGAIQELILHVPNAGVTQSFRLTRRQQLLRFWRAAQPLSTYA